MRKHLFEGLREINQALVEWKVLLPKLIKTELSLLRNQEIYKSHTGWILNQEFPFGPSRFNMFGPVGPTKGPNNLSEARTL